MFDNLVGTPEISKISKTAKNHTFYKESAPRANMLNRKVGTLTSGWIERKGGTFVEVTAGSPRLTRPC